MLSKSATGKEAVGQEMDVGLQKPIGYPTFARLACYGVNGMRISHELLNLMPHVFAVTSVMQHG
jgi:hypothetical protein